MAIGHIIIAKREHLSKSLKNSRSKKQVICKVCLAPMTWMTVEDGDSGQSESGHHCGKALRSSWEMARVRRRCLTWYQRGGFQFPRAPVPGHWCSSAPRDVSSRPRTQINAQGVNWTLVGQWDTKMRTEHPLVLQADFTAGHLCSQSPWTRTPIIKYFCIKKTKLLSNKIFVRIFSVLLKFLSENETMSNSLCIAMCAGCE